MEQTFNCILIFVYKKNKHMISRKYSYILLLFLPLFSLAQTSTRPNIIFILTDDQRWDALGYAGNDLIHTPNMDQLASEGVYFENAFVTTPICAASRASILTGLYERTHDFTFRTPPLAADYVNVSYPKLLKEQNYALGFFGKFGMQLENRMDTLIFDKCEKETTQGYFRLVGEGWSEHIHLTDHTTNKAINFIENIAGEKPFCVSISYNAPHADDTSPLQYFWPARHDKLYSEEVIPRGPLMDEKYYQQLPPFLQDSMTLGRIRWKWRYDSPEKYQRMVKGYYKMISTIDDNLGRLRKRLAELKIADNTIIILLGDNGYFLGERGLAGKWLMYENSIRVPLIIYDPRAEQSRTVQQLALNIDISPTILDYAGIEAPASIQGRSLRPLLAGQTQSWRKDFVCEHLYELPYIPKSEGIRTKKWKYFRYLDYPGNEELYNLERDPMELNNLVGVQAYQGILRHLRTTLDERTSELDKASFSKISK